MKAERNWFRFQGRTRVVVRTFFGRSPSISKLIDVLKLGEVFRIQQTLRDNALGQVSPRLVQV